MTDHEQAAIDAAAGMLHESGCSDPACHYAMHATADLAAERQLAEIALEAAAPHIRAGAVAAERELLAEAEAALWACAKAFLTVEPTLKTPYPDDPRWSPWTRWAERPARQAHDVCMKIRKHLKTTGGDPHA